MPARYYFKGKVYFGWNLDQLDGLFKIFYIFNNNIKKILFYLKTLDTIVGICQRHSTSSSTNRVCKWSLESQHCYRHKPSWTDSKESSQIRLLWLSYNYICYTACIVEQLNWDLLHTRRLIQQCTLYYKIHYNLVNSHSAFNMLLISHN